MTTNESPTDVLLIGGDDEERMLLEDILARIPGAAYQLDHSSSYDAGLERLLADEYAAAFVDLRPSRRSGTELLEEAATKGSLVPLIVLVSERDPEVDRAAMAAGAADLLKESRVDPNEVERSLRCAISRGRGMDAERRCEARIQALEAIGALLATDDMTPATLGRLAALISDRLGHPYLSLYIRSDAGLRVGAWCGYPAVVGQLDPSGPIAQVFRTRRPAFVPNLSVDPHVRGRGEPRKELCLPLTQGADELGLFLVGEPADDPIGEADHAVLVSVADRLTMALMLARDRQEVATGAQVFHRLGRFAAALSSVDDAETLFAAIPRAVCEVVPAEVITLSLAEESSDGHRYLIRGAEGPDAPPLGSLLDLSEPARHALDTGVITIRRLDAATHAAAPRRPTWSATVPLLRGSSVIGVLSLERRGRDLEPLEREALSLIADHLTIALAGWRRTIADRSAVDGLSAGLATRGHVDAALAELLAVRREQPEAERLPLSAVIFEVDGGPAEDEGRHRADVQQVADIVLTRLRARDVVCGDGDRVLALLPGTDPADAEHVATETLRAARAAIGYDAQGLIRAGCGAVDEVSGTPLAGAEAALVMARAVGGDTVIRA